MRMITRIVEKSQTVSAPQRTRLNGTIINRRESMLSGARGVDVVSVPTEVPAVERARWLAEISDALNAAHELVMTLNWHGEQRAEARELFLQIEAARFEVRSLRLSRSLSQRDPKGPEWVDSPPGERTTP